MIYSFCVPALYAVCVYNMFMIYIDVDVDVDVDIDVCFISSLLLLHYCFTALYKFVDPALLLMYSCTYASLPYAYS